MKCLCKCMATLLIPEDNVCRKFKAFSFYLNNSENVQYYDKYNTWLIYIIKFIPPSELPSLLPQRGQKFEEGSSNHGPLSSSLSHCNKQQKKFTTIKCNKSNTEYSTYSQFLISQKTNKWEERPHLEQACSVQMTTALRTSDMQQVSDPSIQVITMKKSISIQKAHI